MRSTASPGTGIGLALVRRLAPFRGLMQDTADGLHAISHPDEATGLLLTWIQQVGGRLTLPDPDDPDLLGIDLSLGAHQPLRAAAPRGSIPRSRLEDRLPFLLLEARQAIVSGSLDCTARVR